MLRFTLTAISLLLLLGAVTTVVTADDDEFVVRSFDLADLVVERPQGTGPLLGAVHMRSRAKDVFPWDDEDAVKPVFTSGHVVELVRSTVDPASWDALRDVWIQANGDRLHVRHRAGVVRRIEALLYQLAKVARRRVLLGVALMEGVPGDGGLAAVPPEPEGCRITSSLPLPVGVRRFVAITNRVDYVKGYDVEIAQGSNISNPIQSHLDEGLVVTAVARPLLDGKRVQVEALLQFACLGEMRTLTTGRDEEYFAEPYRSEERYHNGTIQLPTCSHVDAHVTAIIESGKDLSIPVVVGGRRFEFRLEPRLLGAPGPDRFLDLGALVAESFPVYVGGPEKWAEWKNYERTLRLRTEEDYASRASGGTIEELVELVHRGVSPPRWEEGAERIDPFATDHLLVTARPDLLDGVKGYLTGLETDMLRPVVLDVEVFSVVGGVVTGPAETIDNEGETPIVAGRVHTIPGRWASLRIGTTLNYLADYDAEVAQEARIADPIVGQSFDGLVVNLRPRQSLGSRSWSVDLDLTFSVHELGDEPFEPGPPYMGPIEQIQARRVEIDTTVGVPWGASTVLDAGPDPTDDARTLVIVISNPAR